MVVALGAACWAGASALNRWLTFRSADGGWFNYSPSNGVAFSPSGSQLRDLVVWLVAIAAWFAISFRILRPTEDE